MVFKFAPINSSLGFKLGTARLMDTNFGLLSKWVWRFATEYNPLWKKVIATKIQSNFF